MKMKNRRNFFGLAASFFLGLEARGQAPARGGAKELSRELLSGAQAGMEAILVEVNVMAGTPSTAHRHPGFVMGYVIEGELKFAIDGKTPATVKAGGTFFEPSGALHTTGMSARPDASVRFLAFIVAPKGGTVVMPA